MPPDLLGDRLQQGGAGCGRQGLVRCPAAQGVVAQAQQVAQFSEHRLAALRRGRQAEDPLPDGLEHLRGPLHNAALGAALPEMEAAPVEV